MHQLNDKHFMILSLDSLFVIRYSLFSIRYSLFLMMFINPLMLSSPSVHARRNEIDNIRARLMIQLYAKELVKYPASVTPAANAIRESR